LEDSFTVRQAVWIEDEALIHQIRLTVFVIEQGVSAKVEWDGKDRFCSHALAVSERTGEAIGTGRIQESGHIGRIAVLQAWRGKGVGSKLLKQLTQIAQSKGLVKVYLNSQTHALPFYLQHNFVARGPIFMEAGIPHQQMILDSNSK